MPPTIADRAWAAGFFEGEGSISPSGGYFTLQVKNCDPEPLDRFGAIIGVGKIYGPYDWRKDGVRRKPTYVWVARNAEAVYAFDLLSTWLSTRRLHRANELLAEYPHLR